MKLVVLGATGGTGIEIIRKAMQRGHSVTAFVRSPDKLEQFKGRIAIIQGDLLDSAELARVVKGHDAVLSAFGPRLPLAKSDSKILQRFASALTAALPSAGVKRAVIESTAFLFKDAIMPPAYLVGRMFFSDIVDDAEKMEERFRNSLADWTFVRPPQLTDKPFTGAYRTVEGHLPPFGFSISRADVADCMVKAAERTATIGKVIGASS